MGFLDTVGRGIRNKVAQEIAERETYDAAYGAARLKALHDKGVEDAKKSTGRPGLDNKILDVIKKIRIGPDPNKWKD